MTDAVRIAVADGVMSLTLNRPEKRNALTNAMYGAIADGIARARADDAVRVVVIAGEGGVFTAGNDLGDFAKVASGEVRREDMHVLRLLPQLAACEKPMIAAVEGFAVGIGFTLLLHCDLVYVADDAKLSAPFVDLALVPEAASSLLLPARIGYVRAFSIFALGEAIDGRRAAELGLANAALPAAEVRPAAERAARTLAAKAQGALVAAKRLMRDADILAERIRIERAEFEPRLRSPDAAEAFRAFAEKRPPNFARSG